jgi:ubiquinone/menaquinone biosynthesis C-methylase UbiE
MNIFRRIFFDLWYYRRPPWDSGITPPELLALLPKLPPTRAIDLGCGTGTNVITLARMGWQATGVDFSPRAIQLARQKAKKAQVQAEFQVGDVTNLRKISGPYDFALDLGCFHGLSSSGREKYLGEMERILRPGGIWFIYAFLKPEEDPTAPGLADSDLNSILAGFNLLERLNGFDRKSRPSAYFTFQKR